MCVITQTSCALTYGGISADLLQFALFSGARYARRRRRHTAALHSGPVRKTKASVFMSSPSSAKDVEEQEAH